MKDGAGLEYGVTRGGARNPCPRRLGACMLARMAMLGERELRAAVERGIITAAQADALAALSGDAPAPPPSGAALDPRTSSERPGVTGVTIAYGIGAALVVFGFGWFLVDRWERLGPTGVLLVVTGYAAMFAVVGIRLRREGYHTAGGVATMLAVCMAPLGAWAFARLVGLWPDLLPPCGRGALSLAGCNGQWIIIELATIGAALATLRRVRFWALAVPIAVASAFLALHVVEALLGIETRGRAGAWALWIASSIMLAVAYATDRRQRGDEDFAGPLYLAALVVNFSALVGLWSAYPLLRHAQPLLAAFAIAASLQLRRKVFLAFGAIGVLWYLGWLAFVVFRKALAFPFLLATFGIVVIVLTVWLQRTYPRLMEGARTRAGTGRPRLAAGFVGLLAPALIGLAMLPGAITADRETDLDARIRTRRWMMHAKAERQAELRRARERGEPPPPDPLAPTPRRLPPSP